MSTIAVIARSKIQPIFLALLSITSIGMIVAGNSEALEVKLLLGDGTTGSKLESSDPTKTQLRRPKGAVLRADGSLFVNDGENHRVLRIAPDGKTVDLLIGTGSPGGSFSENPLECELNSLSPSGLALEKDGSLLVVDQQNHRVLRVTADGRSVERVIGTDRFGREIVNGQPSKTQLCYPLSVVVTPNGSLLINDFGNNRILRVNPDQSVECVIGTGSAGNALVVNDPSKTELNNPWGIAQRDDDSILVVDGDNCRVLRVASDLRSVGLVVGTGEQGSRLERDNPLATQLNKPSFVTVAPDQSVIVTDHRNHRILRVTADGSRVEQVAGTGKQGPIFDFENNGRDTQLSDPGRVLVDHDGSLIINDVSNYRVLRRHANGTIERVIGTNNPLDPQYNVLRSKENDVIYAQDNGVGGNPFPRELNKDPLALDPPATVQLKWPDTEVGNDGQLFIVDRGNNRVLLLSQH